MTSDEWDRIDRLARRGAARYARHRLYPDLLQEAMAAAWLCRDDPDGLIVVTVRRRVIDAARRELGRPGERYAAQAEALRTAPLVDIHGVTDDHDISIELGLTGPDRALAGLLALGFTQRSIADRLSLSPSRICQQVRELRQKLTTTTGA